MRMKSSSDAIWLEPCDSGAPEGPVSSMRFCGGPLRAVFTTSALQTIEAISTDFSRRLRLCAAVCG